MSETSELTTVCNDVVDSSANNKRKASFDDDASAKGNKKQKHVNDRKATYSVEGLPDVLFIGFGKKDMQKIGQVPCYAVTPKQLGHFREPANRFILLDLKNVLERVIAITLKGKRRTIRLEDVSTVLASLPHPTDLPPLPSTVSERRGDRRHYRNCLRMALFQPDMRNMATAIVNMLQKSNEKFQKIIKKIKSNDALHPLVFQGSAARVLLDYVEMRLIWFYRDAFIAAGYVGIDDSGRGDGGSGGGDDVNEKDEKEQDDVFTFVIDRKGSGKGARHRHQAPSPVTSSRQEEDTKEEAVDTA